MKYELFDFQKNDIKEIEKKIKEGYKRILYCLATRGGKSGICSYFIEKYKNMNKVIYFICHTNILFDQMSSELSFHGINHGFIRSGDVGIQHNVMICSKDTLKNKLNVFKKPDLIIAEECHLFMADTFMKIINHYKDASVIGLTATPIRKDGKPLNKLFQTMVQGASIIDLQKINRLCQIRHFVFQELDLSGVKKQNGDYNNKELTEKIDKKTIIKNIVEHWKEKALNKKTMTFAASIEHAEHIAKEFNDQGFLSVAISSKDGKQEIDRKINDYYSGKYINLVSVNLFIMGFTISECACIIQARPTESLMIYMQTLGRGMMFDKNKDYLINLDCVNNYSRHGLPEENIYWSLDGKTKEKIPSEFKRCKECARGDVPIKSKQCPFCGYEFTNELNSRCVIPEEVEGKLIEIKGVTLKMKPGKKETIKLIASRAFSEKEAMNITKEIGYSKYYGRYIWRNILRRSA